MVGGLPSLASVGGVSIVSKPAKLVLVAQGADSNIKDHGAIDSKLRRSYVTKHLTPASKPEYTTCHVVGDGVTYYIQFDNAS